jgi:hypothetical protein
MIPMRTSSVFKCRWMALLWAAGIIWFACDVAGSQPQQGNASQNSAAATDANGGPATADDERKLAEALNSF